jgi:cobyrinic acid a,c-diamide synthase
VPPTEHADGSAYEALLLKIADEYLDIDRIQDIARSADELEIPTPPETSRRDPVVKIGYFSDTAFTFYYPENLEALENAGAELVPISSLETESLPRVDGLYIGGGFPETHADRLAGNRSLMDSVKEAAERGMPIYAECGGLIYLCRSLTWQAENYSMANVFPVDLVMSVKPAGHGYCEMVADRANPFFEEGESVRGHEFHYSGPAGNLTDTQTCLQVNTGAGVGERRDGLLYKSTMASYMHIHADGVPRWAPNFVEAARAFNASVVGKSTDAMNGGVDRGTATGGDNSGPRGELTSAKAMW